MAGVLFVGMVWVSPRERTDWTGRGRYLYEFAAEDEKRRQDVRCLTCLMIL